MRCQVLAELDLTADQFVDLCILCGCDYTDKIAGIGPVRALALIKKHGSLEAVLESLDSDKYKIPDPFPYEVGASRQGRCELLLLLFRLN